MLFHVLISTSQDDMPDTGWKLRLVSDFLLRLKPLGFRIGGHSESE